MTQAQLSDGRILDFPDDTPFEVIQGTVKRMLGVDQDDILPTSDSLTPLDTAPEDAPIAPEPVEDPFVLTGELQSAEPRPVIDGPDLGDQLLDRVGDFSERTGARLEEGGDRFQEIFDDATGGKITGAEGVLQFLGENAIAALDIGGDVIASTAGGAFDVLKNIAPETTGDAVKAFNEVADSDQVQAALKAIGEGKSAYDAWADSNPRAAQNIEAAAGLAVLFAPVPKGTPKAPRRTGVVGRAGEKVKKAAVAQEARAQTDFLDDLVSPKLTQKVRVERAARTETGGIFTAGKVRPTAREAEMAEAVGTVRGVSPKNTLTKNLQVVNTGIKRSAIRLEEAVKARPFKIPRQSMIAERKALEGRLADNPLLVGDAAKTASRVGRKAERILKEHPATGAGMLAARKELDAWIKTQRPKALDPAQESALSVAVREVRQSMNNLVDEFAPGVKVKESLKRQSNLFRASENIAAKAANEAQTVVGRLWERVSDALGAERSMKEVLTRLGGLGTFATGAVIVPDFAIKAIVLGAAVTGAKVFVTSSTAKRAISTLLRASEKAIKKSTDPATIKQLRADRAAVMEIFRAIQVQENGGK